MPLFILILTVLLVNVLDIKIIKYIFYTISIALLLGGTVNLYALYTYIEDLNKTNCTCAVTELKYVNTFLYYWRYIMVASYVLAILLVLMSIFTGKFVVSLQSNFTKK